MIELVAVGAGAKGLHCTLNSRRTGYANCNLYADLISDQMLIGAKAKKVFGDSKAGEPLIPESLTINIPLTDCDYKRIPTNRIPTNHAPDAAALP